MVSVKIVTKFHRTDRRRLLRHLAGVAALAVPGAAMAGEVCYDSAKLRDLSLRRSLNFKEIAPDATRNCGGCAFFTASSAGCGKCMLLSGGPVSALSVCDNWAAKV